MEGIFSGEYKPNQILNEKELVEKYGCSKSPIRDALITLCNEGVLRNIPRYGYEVIRLTKEMVEDQGEPRITYGEKAQPKKGLARKRASKNNGEIA